MAKIELTISTEYQRNWGVWEGIRELVANGFDAEVEHNAVCNVDWYNNTIRIENQGVTLPREALLLGHSSKMDRSDTIGQFGEGLKIGILALLRQGVPVKIRNGSEVWIPSIQKSDKFNSDVLVFNISTGRSTENRIRVEIGNCDKEAYDLICSRFLKLQKLDDSDHVKVPYEGSLLLTDKFRGKIFVRGVFIKEIANLNYGYDFESGRLNRDRDVLDDIDYRTKNLWSAAVGLRPDLFDSFYKMLESSEADVRGITQFSAPYLPETVKDSVAATFTERYGDKVIPVATMAESKDAEHFGVRGVVVNPSMLAILGEKVGTFETVKERVKSEVTTTYSWHDLTDSERDNLSEATTVLNAVIDYDILSVTTIADFRSETLEGLYKDGNIIVARKILQDSADTLKLLIHEWCHQNGGDGDKNHVYSIEEIWAKVYRKLSSN